MTPATVAAGLPSLIGGLGVLVLLMADAHEWAESLRLKRCAAPLRSAPDSALPFVSVQVPACPRAANQHQPILGFTRYRVFP